MMHPSLRLRRPARVAATWLAALSLAMACARAVPQEHTGWVPVELTEAEQAWLAKHPVIRIGAETNYAPYEFQDSKGRFIGVVADYLELIKQRLDVRFEVYQLLDFQSVENKLRSRELDVVLALTPTAEREEFLGYTKPYLHYVNVVVTRDDFGLVTGLRDFEGQRVAVVGGHSSQTLVARAYPNFDVTAYSDLLDALMAVSTGKEAGLVDDIFPIVYNIRYRQISNLKIATPLERALQPQGFSVAVRKDWPQLVSVLDKVLATISQEEQREISQKWLSVRYESKIDYRAIWTATAVSSGILLVAFFWIRQLNRQRRALLAARTAAEAANRAKDEFLASMSHELRTPLHAILGYADVLQTGTLPDPARRDALGTIAGSGRHLLALINDLLDLSRIRSSHLELNPTPVQLPRLLEEIVAMVRVDASNKGLEFVLQTAADLPAVVEVDDRRLRQILLNLLGNAIKFTDTGQVVLRVQSTPREGGRVQLRMSVEDTGVGIGPQDKLRIFAPFEQAGEGQRREPGVGLGLAISQELARVMGGAIEVDSEAGKGSHFHFTVELPVLQEQIADAAVLDTVIGYAGPRRRILVADDQEENRRLLRQMLEPLGFQVVVAADGQAALAAARDCRPDLAVLDLRMPVMTGFDAARAIRDTAGLETVPLVAASASSADLDRAKADPGTFAMCLRKPFQTRDLLEAIAQTLRITWNYAEAERISEHASHSPVALPPADLLGRLLELARLGKLVRVEQMARDLERGDARYRPFARRLYELAHGFEEEQLVTLLQDSLEAAQDAVSH